MSANPASQPAVQALDGTAWMQLIALSLLWGASFIFIRIAAVDIPIFTLVFVRVALAALALHGVILVTGRAYPTRLAMYGRYGLMGLLNNAIPFILIVYATPRIGAGAASILNATTPIFTLIVAHILTADEKITAGKAGGILLGFAGVVVMIGPKAFGGLSTEVLAALAMLGATLAYGFSALVGRSFRGIDPVVSAGLPADRFNADPGAAGDRRGDPLAAGDAGHAGNSGSAGFRAFIDGARLYPVLPHHRARRWHQCHAGDAAHPD
jgi:hypothetical protein